MIGYLPPNVCCHLLAGPLKMGVCSCGCFGFGSSVLGSGASSAQLQVDASLERVGNGSGTGLAPTWWTNNQCFGRH